MNRHRAGKPASRPLGEVRVIGGSLKRSKLPVPDRPGLRPTPDRVRETLFNWLAPRIAGARVLDLCAGTGVLAIEALSRGAAQAWINEPDAQLADLIATALARLKIADRARLTRQDARRLLAHLPPQGIDIAFIDPPYTGELWVELLAALPRTLAADARVYVEHPAEIAAPWDPAHWHAPRAGRAGRVRYALLEQAAGSASLAAVTAEEPAP
ncbi:MAG: 16S rRNA (guanine(966)-N(2))-methyltransferase RsmD [Xanthomonadales bacterium]|nr:Ribosomal RNA small subunit methyltransferase D [Xanthomonadales bacterium]MCC6592824.1 16S rRNA (guanine(966)-N(2))-methyltransferase RsmD [Xanthomonadales bacterium]